MKPAQVVVWAETIGDYCLGRAQDRIESFDACMRNAEESSDHFGAVLTFIVVAGLVSVFLYKRSQVKQAEAAAAESERLRRQALSPEQRVAEDVAEARAKAIRREQSIVEAEELAAYRRMWASGSFLPGIPLPPPGTGPRPKPPGNAPPGWYDAPPGDGYGLYYYQNYPFQYWDGQMWVERTAPPSQHYYWTRR